IYSLYPLLKVVSGISLHPVSLEYVNWFYYRRISSKTKGMSPCEYREHTLAA
ncbi:hypothetical protein B2D45_14720, partial [Lactobacillus hilgardii]